MAALHTRPRGPVVPLPAARTPARGPRAGCLVLLWVTACGDGSRAPEEHDPRSGGESCEGYGLRLQHVPAHLGDGAAVRAWVEGALPGLSCSAGFAGVVCTAADAGCGFADAQSAQAAQQALLGLQDDGGEPSSNAATDVDAGQPTPFRVVIDDCWCRTYYE